MHININNLVYCSLSSFVPTRRSSLRSSLVSHRSFLFVVRLSSLVVLVAHLSCALAIISFHE
jgi:hypothetical protein